MQGVGMGDAGPNKPWSINSALVICGQKYINIYQATVWQYNTGLAALKSVLGSGPPPSVKKQDS